MPISRKDHAEFYFHMARHTQATPAQCERLLRYAATLHRLDVERWSETEADRRKVARIQARVRDCLRYTVPPCSFWAQVVFTWEPMAPPFVIVTPDGWSNCAGDVKGIGVPA